MINRVTPTIGLLNLRRGLLTIHLQMSFGKELGLFVTEKPVFHQFIRRVMH